MQTEIDSSLVHSTYLKNTACYASSSSIDQFNAVKVKRNAANTTRVHTANGYWYIKEKYGQTNRVHKTESDASHFER